MTGTGRADSETGMPRWVKWFLLVGLIVLVAVVMLLVFGGDHGPGRHGSLPAPASLVLAL